jgi:hypothetical protein
MAGTQSSIRGKILVWFAWVAGTGVLGFFIVMWLGQVNGEEFNPYTLDRRSFYYYQIPGLRLQVSPINRKTLKGGFEKHLINKKLVKVTNTSAWHLVRATGARQQPVQGDASILIDYFGSGSSSWKTWSSANPKLAVQFWPVVIDLARRNHYLLIPDLMELALENTDRVTSDFSLAIHRSLVEQYLYAARIERQQGGSEPTTEMVDFAVEYASGNDDLEALVSGFENGSK